MFLVTASSRAGPPHLWQVYSSCLPLPRALSPYPTWDTFQHGVTTHRRWTFTDKSVKGDLTGGLVLKPPGGNITSARVGHVGEVHSLYLPAPPGHMTVGVGAVGRVPPWPVLDLEETYGWGWRTDAHRGNWLRQLERRAAINWSEKPAEPDGQLSIPLWALAVPGRSQSSGV